MVDITSRKIVARLELPGAARAVAVSRDGRRGYVSAGRTIVTVDVNEKTQIARRSSGRGRITALAVSPNGRRLYAVQGRRLRVLKASTLGQIGSVSLGGRDRGPVGPRTAARHTGR